MKAADVCIFLTSYSLVVAFAAVADYLRRREPPALITMVIAIGAVSATTVVGFYLEPGTSYFGLLWFLATERDFSALVSVGMGVAAALVWTARLCEWSLPFHSGSGPRPIRRWIVQSLLAASVVGVVLGGQAFIWKSLLGITREASARIHAPGFVVERVAKLDYYPIRLAADDGGKVYVSYDYFEDSGEIGGAIVELSPDPATGAFRKRIVADSPLLVRPYGLAARNGELFVSRSGFCPRASMGKVSYESTGAVTQLKDVNNDGYFEYAHDIVSNLPGLRGPETMQQNNGIVFARDGSLFVTSASAANRAIDEHPWGGAVLRISPDFARTEVYAKGFRNPFGITIGPDNEVFACDNDVDENPGDELIHVIRDAHYGHPYVIPSEGELGEFREAILVSDKESNYLGMAYATSPSLPEEYRNCMYVTDFMKNEVLCLRLARAGDTYKVTRISRFVSLPSPVDITVTSSGEFFVISRTAKTVYRIRNVSAKVDRG